MGTLDKSARPTTYETARLGLAAFLIALGDCKLISLSRVDGSRFQFTLAPKPLKSQIDSFFDGSGNVSALAFFNTLTSLKSALWEAKSHG